MRSRRLVEGKRKFNSGNEGSTRPDRDSANRASRARHRIVRKALRVMDERDE